MLLLVIFKKIDALSEIINKRCAEAMCISHRRSWLQIVPFERERVANDSLFYEVRNRGEKYDKY